MPKTDYQISIILPTYNESKNIIPLIEKVQSNLANYSFEILVIDDESPDKTGVIARKKFISNKNIKIFIRKEKGLASAVLFGLKNAGGATLAVMDTDFNHDPSELIKMYSLINQYDLIVGSRYVAGGGMENPFRNFVSMIYNRIIKLLLTLSTHDNLSGFFMIKKVKIDNLLTRDIFKGYGDYFIRMLFRAHKKKMLIAEIPVFYKNRVWGISKSNFFNMFMGYSKTVLELLSE